MNPDERRAATARILHVVLLAQIESLSRALLRAGGTASQLRGAIKAAVDKESTAAEEKGGPS